jgi:hypothetical protein
MFISIALAMLFMLLVFMLSPGARPRRVWMCGHERSSSIAEKVRGIMRKPQHTCSYDASAFGLFAVFYGQRAYHETNGTFARTLSELSLANPLLPVVTMESDGREWQARLAKQNDLPGHYLLSSDGRIHFSVEEPATTNDPVFHTLK